MSNSQFLNFKKSRFSHQVALVDKDRFICKSLIQFAITIILNYHIAYIYCNHFSCLIIDFCNLIHCKFVHQGALV